MNIIRSMIAQTGLFQQKAVLWQLFVLTSEVLRGERNLHATKNFPWLRRIVT
jgi:hypothetical protein